jgi:hypothetical protein
VVPLRRRSAYCIEPGITQARSVRAERDARAFDAMRRIAATYPRFG